ncbi:HAUS augmin-like complex subunit 1 [Actinomortierella ambigua]|nr:HAUS augmin-like complex subunit 1 [Actinomortierella ambigua]
MEWEKIDQWLQQKYAPQAVPFFERNEESLQILSAMIDANQDQDARALRALEEARSYADAYRAEGERRQTANRIFGLDKASLSPQAASHLDALVDLAMLLGLDSVSLPSFQQALLHHADQYKAAVQTKNRSQALQTRLDNHLAQANATAQTLHDRLQPQLLRQRDEVDQVQIKIWQRHAELLLQKVDEYQHQLQDIRARQQQQQQQQQKHLHNPVRLAHLQTLQSSIHELELQIADRDQALAVYTELPPDYKLARLKLSEAKFKLEQLLIEQESLMQDLADGL